MYFSLFSHSSGTQSDCIDRKLDLKTARDPEGKQFLSLPPGLLATQSCRVEFYSETERKKRLIGCRRAFAILQD